MNQEFPGFGQSGPDVKRLFAAAIAGLAVSMAVSYFFAPTPHKVQEKIKASQVLESKAGQPAPALELDPTIVSTPTSVPEKRSNFEVSVSNKIIEKDPAFPQGGYQVALENRGARISELSLLGYKEPVKLLQGPHAGIFFLRSRNNGILNENSSYEILETEQRQIVYQRVTPEGFRILRRYQFSDNNYLLRHEIEIRNDSNISQRLDLDLVFQTEGEVEASSYFSGPSNELNFLAHREGKLVRHSHTEILESPLNLVGPTDFIALEQRYFLLSILPKEPSRVSKVTVNAQKLDQKKGTFQSVITVALKPVELAPRAVVKWEFDSFAGPKQLGLLKEVGHSLDEAVNFGWFGVISRPLLWLLVEIFRFVHNFGIAIILLTLLIKLLTYPLTQKSFVSMQQVKKIGPELKVLEKKYGHDRTMLSQKQMELYREKGVNPMAGCLPMFLQFPVWIALYQMLSNSIEIYQKPFAGWLMDLTQPDPYYVLPVLMGISMVIQQLLQPVQDDQKAMKYAMLGTSVLFTFIMLNLPSGLSLYMFTNNILTLIQQVLIKRRFEERTA